MSSPLPQNDLNHILTHTEHLWKDLHKRSLFLSGGTGFVGTWLLESLLWTHDKLDLNVDVVVLTRNFERFSIESPHLAGHPAVRFVNGNITSFAFPEGEYQFIIHAATEPYFEPDWDHPLSTFNSDIEGTQRILDFAKMHGARRFLFTSSGAIYGKQPVELTHIPEEYAGAPLTTDANSAYGQAKRISEFMGMMYGRMYGFDAMIARLFAFVGPRLPLDANYAVGNFIRDALKGGAVRITGDGTPYRSFLYAADLTIWLWTILFRGKAGNAYNVGSTNEITIMDLAKTVLRTARLDTTIDISLKSEPGKPAARYVPLTLRSEKELGLKQFVSLEEGIERTLTWHREKVR
jgi:nucleoside-diphosphate-sugar epimerase